MLLQAGMIALEYDLRRKEEISDLQDYLKQSAQLQAAILDANFSAVAQIARSTASYLKQVEPKDDLTLTSLLVNTLSQNPLIEGAAIAYLPSVRDTEIYVNRTNGDLRVLTLAYSDFNYTLRPWFSEAMAQNEAVWSGPYRDSFAPHHQVITFSVPFIGVGGGKGIIAIDLRLDKMSPAEDWMGLWGGFVRIINQHGTYLSSLPPSMRTADNEINNDNIFLAAKRLNLPALAEAGHMMLNSKSGIVKIPDPIDGIGMFWLAYAPISNTGWSLSVLVDEAIVLRDVYSYLKWNLIIAIVICFLVLLAIVFITRHMMRPLVRLNDVAQAVGRGNFELRMGKTGTRDEIGSFAHAFDTMLDNLKAAISERMREAEARQALQREMALARDIQRNLLPPSQCNLVAGADFELYALCKSATNMSGDFYDYFLLNDDTLALVIADVCGKGMPAALYMALIRTTLRNFSTIGHSPLETVQAANAALVQDNPDAMFVTLFLAYYNLSTGSLQYVCAGHPPPLVRQNDGSLKELAGEGTVLGVFVDGSFSEESVTLQPGEQLMLFTDGVTEAGTCNDDPYGEERLVVMMDALKDKPICEAAESIADELLRHAGGEQEDDITLMILRRRKTAEVETAL